MIGLETDLSVFNASIGQRIQALKLYPPAVVKKQAGLLAWQCIQMPTPGTKGEGTSRVRSDIEARYEKLSKSFYDSFERNAKSGRGDVKWYASTSSSLFGINKDADKRNLSDEDVYQLTRKLRGQVTKSGRIKAGKHGKQSVYILQKTTVTKSGLAYAIKRLQGHVGWLKSGWLPAWISCGRPGKKTDVPEWVTKHYEKAGMSKLPGYYVDSTKDRDPSFTIANFAPGIGEMGKSHFRLLKLAMQSRVANMEKDMAFLIRNPDKADQILKSSGERL